MNMKYGKTLATSLGDHSKGMGWQMRIQQPEAVSMKIRRAMSMSHRVMPKVTLPTLPWETQKEATNG